MNFELSETRKIIQKPNSGLRENELRCFRYFRVQITLALRMDSTPMFTLQSKCASYNTLRAGNGCEDGAGGVM